MRVYNRALSAAEITSGHDEGRRLRHARGAVTHPSGAGRARRSARPVVNLICNSLTPPELSGGVFIFGGVLLFQLDDRGAAAALILRSGVKLLNLRMRFQERGNALAQLPGAVAVHDADLVEIGDQGVVEKT